MKDQDILDQISKEKNHAQKSKQLYAQAVKHYTTLFSMSLTDLLKEADDEEEAGIRWKKRKLRKRLLIFRNYLVDSYKPNTVSSYFGNIIAIYRHLEFELQRLPKISTKQSKREKPLEYKDLPPKLVIREAMRRVSLAFQCVIILMTSGGFSRMEIVNLIVQDYIDSTYIYHKLKTDDIYLVIEKLKELQEQGVLIVPQFNLQRQKTGVYYFTFISPEGVDLLNTYLVSRKGILEPDDPLIKLSYKYIGTKFAALNDEMGLGFVGEYRRLRSHMLRKFHASNLKLGEFGLSEDIINELQGRVKPGVNQTYFFEKSEEIKEAYIKAMPNILINWEIERVTVDTPEVQKIKIENQKLIEEIENINNNIEEEVGKQIRSIMAESWRKTQEKL